MFGTSSGLFTLKEDQHTWQAWTAGNSGLPGDNVRSIRGDTAGRAWLATDKGVVLLAAD
jgi:ligand-binding sensor domain-containing protein